MRAEVRIEPHPARFVLTWLAAVLLTAAGWTLAISFLFANGGHYRRDAWLYGGVEDNLRLLAVMCLYAAVWLTVAAVPASLLAWRWARGLAGFYAGSLLLLAAIGVLIGKMISGDWSLAMLIGVIGAISGVGWVIAVRLGLHPASRARNDIHA